MPHSRCQCGRKLLFRPEQGGGIVTCPKCSSLVKLPIVQRPLIRLSPAPAKDEGKLSTPERPSFRLLIPQAFQYPLQRTGFAIGMLGVIAFTAAHYMAVILYFLPLVGWLGIILVYVGLLGYYIGYATRIMWSSAKGKWEMPLWPEMSNTTQNVFAPFLYFMAGAVISLGPYLAYHLTAGSAAKWTTELELLAAGMIYLPMNLLCAALSGTEALSPLTVLRAIISAPAKYSVIWLIAVLLAVIQAFGGRLADEYMPLPFFGRLFQEAVSLYLLFVGARLLGLVYYSSREKMRWLVSDRRVRRSSGPETIE